MRGENIGWCLFNTDNFPLHICVYKIIIIIFSSYIKCVYDFIISQLTWLGYVIVLLSMGLSPQGYTVRYILVVENIRYTQ